MHRPAGSARIFFSGNRLLAILYVQASVPGPVTQELDTQDTDTENPESDTLRLRKSKRKLTPKQWTIMMVAPKIYEDACIFETVFPTPPQDMTARIDTWRSAARQCNIKEKIPDLDDDLDPIVSGTFTRLVYMLI